MEVTGYIAQDVETATYKDDVVLIVHTKQDLPTVVLLSDEGVENLIADLRSRQKSLFQQLWDRWNDEIRSRRQTDDRI